MYIQELKTVSKCITLIQKVTKAKRFASLRWCVNRSVVMRCESDQPRKSNLLVSLILFSAVVTSALLAISQQVLAQENFSQAAASLPVELEQVRWKSKDQIRSLLGDPKSIRGPIGTHASYELWNYEGFGVAFANNRAFHLFDENSLHKIQLEENR